jgi:hypothetical protein
MKGIKIWNLVLNIVPALQMLELCDPFQSFTVYILITDSV